QRAPPSCSSLPGSGATNKTGSRHGEPKGSGRTFGYSMSMTSTNMGRLVSSDSLDGGRLGCCCRGRPVDALDPRRGRELGEDLAGLGQGLLGLVGPASRG